MKTILMFAAAATATPAPKPAPAPSEIVAAAPAGDWVAIAATDLLVIDLATEPENKQRRVIIQLMPPPFSQGWVGNVRKLATAHWWDGTSINRVQDNYVVQWGDANAEDKERAKRLPQDLAIVLQTQYQVARNTASYSRIQTRLIETAKRRAALETANNKSAEALRNGSPLAVAFPLPPLVVIQRDLYSQATTFDQGWPIAISDEAISPIHCYGMVGVGRDMPPNTGSGAELYTVIGHAPRHLDRNIALVGRVISGIEHLSSLPRGTGDLGFYKTPAERTAITSIRLGTEVKDLQHFEYLSTESASFAAYADARANRRDPFFIRPAGGADICNIPVPVRVAK